MELHRQRHAACKNCRPARTTVRAGHALVFPREHSAFDGGDARRRRVLLHRQGSVARHPRHGRRRHDGGRALRSGVRAQEVIRTVKIAEEGRGRFSSAAFLFWPARKHESGRISHMTALPETRYVKSGDVHIAYQVVGDGPLDIVYVPGFVSNVEATWDSPARAAFLRRLASFSRLILFDKRGTGLSDRSSQIFTLEQRMSDVQAIMDAVGSKRAALMGVSEG